MVREDMPKIGANYRPLSPITFLERAAEVFPHRESIIYGIRRFTWQQTLSRCRLLASALDSKSIGHGDKIAVVAPNIPASYELHFAVAMTGAVLNPINVRLNAETIGVILHHSKAKMVFVDTEFLHVVQEALRTRASLDPAPEMITIIHVADETITSDFNVEELCRFQEYEEFIKDGNPTCRMFWPLDEWDAISINYTSGTTSVPKGVVYHHRGAYLASVAIALDWAIPTGAVYLWTLPMFHCNGWCFPWIMAALGGTNICLRKVTAENIYDNLFKYGVTHMSGAPTVLNMMVNAEPHAKKILKAPVHIMTAGAAPPAPLLARIETQGFSVSHFYGLTETYGPTLSCAWKKEWDSLPMEEQLVLKARQGVGNLGILDTKVFDPKTMLPVPHDGKSVGEVMVKGHTIMKGYWMDEQATKEAFTGGWFHTGDLGVMDQDGYLRLVDRSKDIIISGGENISSIEVESVMYKHPQVLEVAVVARPHPHWGETPCAFVVLKDFGPHALNSERTSELSLIAHCKSHLPSFKIPRTIIFSDSLPKTATGKIQKHLLRKQAKQLISTPFRESKL